MKTSIINLYSNFNTLTFGINSSSEKAHQRDIRIFQEIAKEKQENIQELEIQTSIVNAFGMTKANL
ncbi:hypothetical protein IJ670_07235 [bacterium]|nr:hypothetical protein [bacterium]